MVVIKFSFLYVLTISAKECWSLLPVVPTGLTSKTPQNIRRAIVPWYTQGDPSVSLNMALVPLPVEDLEEFLVVGPPSGPQYATYWGRTKVICF